MFKRFASILMLYSALAIMLGHDFIEHHHNYDFEQNVTSHHHSDGHHHHSDGHHHDINTDTDDDKDTDDESDDWKHLFSIIEHGVEGLPFLTNHSSVDNFSKQIPQFIAVRISNFIFKQTIIEVRQNAPPFIVAYYNSQILLPSGLRAPPVFIV